MRDVNRIDPTLDALKDFWKKYPDWRLGQLLCNVGRAMGRWDCFFLEDDDLKRFLDEMNADPEKLREVF